MNESAPPPPRRASADTKEKCSLLFGFAHDQFFLKMERTFFFLGFCPPSIRAGGGTMRTKFWQNYFLGKGFAKTSAHLFLNSDVANGKGGVWGGIFHLLLFLFGGNSGRTKNRKYKLNIVLLLFYYFYSSSGIKYSATEFIQNLLPVGCGPSSNTCPRCEPQVSRTSILSSKSPLSFRSTSASSDIGAKKLGQPVPESYFCSDLKSGLSQPTL